MVDDVTCHVEIGFGIVDVAMVSQENVVRMVIKSELIT